MGSVGQIAVGRHEYGLRTGQKVGCLIFAVIAGAMAASFFLASAGDPHPAPIMVASAAFAALGLYMALLALRSRLTIDGTRVRVQGAFRTRQFDLSQVEGYRTYQGRYQSFRVLCLRDDAGKIALRQYATDDALDEWLDRLKDLDEQDREQFLEKIGQDQQLGSTPDERRSALDRAKRLNFTAWAVDGVAVAAFAFAPSKWRLAAMAVLALAPVMAAYLVYRQPLLYTIFKPRSDPRGDMSPLLMISGFGLLLGATRANFISIGLLFPFIGLGMFSSMAMFYPAARRNPRFAATMAGLCFLSAIYGGGLARAYDTVADRSAPQTYTAQVLGGYVSHGSRSTSYYLELEPWGPYVAVSPQMEVSAEMYSQTRTGDVVCLAVHPGALHVPWYELTACGSATQQPANP
ncbi:MAG: hypothetical protein WBG54_19450 [Acidobacteriaceae bacterium]